MGRAKVGNRNRDKEESVTHYYGTKPGWVTSEPQTVTVDGETFTDVVSAEDEDGVYYTRMSEVRANVTDVYRLYRRDKLKF